MSFLIANSADHEMPCSVQAALYFLVRDDLFLAEKPYAFRFPIDGKPLSQTNMKMERKELIRINDIRGNEKLFSFDKNGFEVLSHKSELRYEDFYRPEKISTYLRELESVLKDRLKASHVEVFRHGVSLTRTLDFLKPGSKI
jgi:hypothetical protein